MPQRQSRSKSSSPSERTVGNANKTYGNTTIGGAASVQLGDISHNVKIDGGLHLHLHNPLEPLSVVAEIVDALQVAANFLELAAQLVEGSFEESNIIYFLKLVDRFEPLLKHLTFRQDSSFTLSGLGGPAKESLYDLIVSTRAFLHDANDIHEELFDEIRLLVRPEIFNVDADGVRVAKRRRREPVVISDSKRALANFLENRLFGVQGVVQLRESIERKLAQLASFRQQVQDWIKTIVNEYLGGSDLGVFNPLERTQSLSSQIPSESSKVVEVLSINQRVAGGLQPLAAILTRRNGDCTVLTQPRTRCHANEDSENSNLVKYDLDSGTREATPFKPLSLESAYDFMSRIRSALYFREESDRQAFVRDAHWRTFDWILSDAHSQSRSDLRVWLPTDNGCFWVEGKAGSGKSTLMKFVHQHPALKKLLARWAATRELIIASFFFWRAGQPLQKSYEGVLRSLTYQILGARPDLTPVMFPRLSRYLLHKGSSGNYSISVEELQEAILLLTKNMPEDLTMFLMIDGVDEYSGDHFEFSSFLVRISNTPNIKVLVSSRPIPQCVHFFSQHPFIRLQDLTESDIRAYIDEELLKDQSFLEMAAYEDGLTEHIMRELTSKASGVFLWVTIVVKRLQVGLCNFDDKDELLAKIDELPSDLELLYDHMFGQMSGEYQRAGSMLLQLICRAQEMHHSNLTALHLYEAMRCCSQPDFDRLEYGQKSFNPEDRAKRVKIMEGRLRSRCCGLVEVRYGKKHEQPRQPWVDFLHRSVYDYLQDEVIWLKLRNSCKLAPVQRDLSLLIASVRMLEHWTAYSSIHEPELFTDCLSYSCALNSVKSTSYVDWLEKADEVWFNSCVTKNALFAASASEMYIRAYNKCYEKFPEFKGPEEHGAKDSFITDRESVLMIHTVKLGLLASFEKYVKTPYLSNATKSVIMVQLLQSFYWRKEEVDISQRYINAIKILCDSGADPNSPVNVEKSNSAARATPWGVWMQIFRGTQEDIIVTHHLVKCGRPDKESKAYGYRDILYAFTLAIRQCKRTCEDEKTAAILDEIISRADLNV